MAADRLLLTQPEAADRLGVGVRALRDLVKRRKLRIVSIGRRALIPAADLERFVSEAAECPSTAVPVRRSGGRPSLSLVVGFDEALALRPATKPKS